MLVVDGIVSGYGDIDVLHGVSLTVADGELVALVGSNGAGKTTLLRTISRLLPVKTGRITWNGVDLASWKPHTLASWGICHVPEGRGVLTQMTVLENLLLGAYARRAERASDRLLRSVYDLFPVLRDRSQQLAGTLSGGEQQMLAIGRALMGQPSLLLLDEPSLGVAPVLAHEIFKTLERIRAEGVAILLVEQNVVRSLELADRAYVLESGRIVLEGDAKELLTDPRLQRAYLGLSNAANGGESDAADR